MRDSIEIDAWNISQRIELVDVRSCESRIKRMSEVESRWGRAQSDTRVGSRIDVSEEHDKRIRTHSEMVTLLRSTGGLVMNMMGLGWWFGRADAGRE